MVGIALRGYVRRQTRQEAVLEEIKREAGAIITELNATTERNIELLEERIQRISELVATADRRIGTLRKENSIDQSVRQTYTHLGDRRSHRPADATNGDPTVEPAAQAERSEQPTVDIRTRVRNLHYSGMSSSQIASTVGKTVGEVELIISLASPPHS